MPIADLPMSSSDKVYLRHVLLTPELTDAYSVFVGKFGAPEF